MKVRKIIELNEIQRTAAFARERIGDKLYEKLKDDPNYALVSMFCTNIGILAAARVEQFVPEEGSFSPLFTSTDNLMWTWENFEMFSVAVENGYKSPAHRMLYLHIPFPDGSDRVMSQLLLSGTKQEILDYLRSREFGPALMTSMDSFDISLGDKL